MAKGEKMRYKILYKLKKESKPGRLDHIFPSSPELVRFLDTKEGINAETADYIYVHEFRPDGTVVETYIHDERTTKTECVVGEDKCNIHEQAVERESTVKVANGFYEVREAN